MTFTVRPLALLPALPLALLLAFALSGCVSLEVGNEPATQLHLALRDDAQAPVQRLAQPLLPALLIQAQPGTAMADTLSIAFTRREPVFGYYQFASWVDRPVRQLPRLLQQRLQARGLATAVGVQGEPMRADWLLTLRIDALHHDVRTEPGRARLALVVELFDRRSQTRLAQQRFAVDIAAERADSTAAALAMSQAVGQSFDQLLPWLEAELQRLKAAPKT